MISNICKNSLAPSSNRASDTASFSQMADFWLSVMLSLSTTVSWTWKKKLWYFLFSIPIHFLQEGFWNIFTLEKIPDFFENSPSEGWILVILLHTVFPHIVSAPLCTVTFGFPNSKKNSFRGNYMRKYGSFLPWIIEISTGNT